MIFFNICIAWFSYIALCQPVHSDTWNGDIPQPFSFLFYFFYKNILSNRYLLFIFLNYPTKSLYKFISILNIFQYFEHIFLENLFLYLVVYARKPLFYETFIVPNCKKETQTYDLRVMRTESFFKESLYFQSFGDLFFWLSLYFPFMSF